MERAVIHTDLKLEEIQPSALLGQYLSLLEDDIRKHFAEVSLHETFCPVSGEKEVQHSFLKLGMEYRVSRSLGNIYLSPRPGMEVLKKFYKGNEGSG